MDKDILLAVILILIVCFCCYYLKPSTKDTFASVENQENIVKSSNQENVVEPTKSFDPEINSVKGNDTHGSPFSDEHLESGLSTDKKAQVIVFLSKTCPHCVTYDKEKFHRLKGKLHKLTKGNVEVKKVFPDNDPSKLFEKYDIMFVPSAVVIRNNTNSKISGEISPANIIKTINKLD